MNIERQVDKSIDKIVDALCLDYERRAKAICEKSVGRRTETEYRYLNFHILEAAEEVVGERFAKTYISEIGKGIGYAKTDIDCVSEVTYKSYKRLIRNAIAKSLHLID